MVAVQPLRLSVRKVLLLALLLLMATFEVSVPRHYGQVSRHEMGELARGALCTNALCTNALCKRSRDSFRKCWIANGLGQCVCTP
jgi:hypothetical protein